MKNLKITLVKSEKDFYDFAPLLDGYSERKNSEEEIETLKKDLFSDNSIISIIIARLDNEVVGFMLLLKSYTSSNFSYIVHLQDFYVVPEYRNKGIGTEFFSYIKKYAKENNYPRVQWITKKTNLKSQNFYNKYDIDNNRIYYKMPIK